MGTDNGKRDRCAELRTHTRTRTRSVLPTATSNRATAACSTNGSRGRVRSLGHVDPRAGVTRSDRVGGRHRVLEYSCPGAFQDETDVGCDVHLGRSPRPAVERSPGRRFATAASRLAWGSVRSAALDEDVVDVHDHGALLTV